MNRAPSQSSPGIRWWPAVVILALMLGLLAWLWLKPADQTQARVIATFPTLFFGVVLLFLWAILFSRLRGFVRLGIFLAVAAVVAAGSLMFEIVGVDGNLVPILGFRYAGERSFGQAASAVGEAQAGESDYPQFYGPGRDATLPGVRLARDWDASPPRELWRREVGEGWSAFAVVGQAAVTQEQRGDQEVVVRYHLETGAQEWVHADTAPFNTTIGGKGPRATPTIAGDRVYTLGATGLLSCLELADGRKVWSRDVLADTGSGQPDWGTPSSPLVVGDLVVVAVGRGGTPLAAYDRESGEPAWTASGDSAAYSTPTLGVVGGREQILVVNQGSVAGHDPVSGELLWRAAWPGHGEKVTPPLQLGGDRFLVSAGYGQGSQLFEVAGGEGEYSVEQHWESLGLKSKFASMVVHEGVVYGLDDGIMVALDPATGERHWKRGRYGHGQMILAGDLLLILTEKGQVVLVEPSPEELREIARLDALDGKTWNPPALAGDVLLVRNNREAAAYRLPLVG